MEDKRPTGCVAVLLALVVGLTFWTIVLSILNR